jgi:hypothetical protein
MRRSVIHGGLILALLGGAATVSAIVSADRVQSEGAEVQLELASADPAVTDGAGRPSALPLSDAQRHRIFELLAGLTETPVADMFAPDLVTRVPGAVPLQDLPAGVGYEIPQARGFKFVRLEDRILLVSPASRAVVDQIAIYRIVW